MADRETAPSEVELQSIRSLRELLLNIIREIEGGSFDSNTLEALHFSLDWLQGLIARLLDVFGIDEQILILIKGARDCLVGSQDTGETSSSICNGLI